MRKTLVSILAIAVLAGGYLAYDRWLASPKVYAWDFIPNNAAVVLETSETLSVYDSIRDMGVWRVLDNSTFANEIEEKLAELDSMDTSGSLREVFKNSPSLIALFPISVTELDALFVLKFNSSKQRNYLKRCVEAFKESGYRFKNRSYHGFTIEEFYKRADGDVFSFIRHKNYLIGSFSPFLVEDAIRAFINPEEVSFESIFGETRALKPLDQDEGNVYVNMSEVNSLLNLFPKSSQGLFGRSAFLDMDVENSSVKLTGFTFPDDELLSTFTSGPGSFDLLDVIPNNTARLTHYSFEDAETWRSKLKNFDEDIRLSTDRLKEKFDIDPDFLFSQINQEIAVADLEVVGTANPDRLIFLDIKDISEASQFLKQAAQRMSSDSIFVDQVGNYVVRKLDIGLARALLGTRSSLESECYYIVHREYIIMSNSLSQIKRLIQSLESDNTWRRSLQVNTLLDLASRGANYSSFVHVPRSWNQLMNELKPDWKSVFDVNATGLKSMEYLSFQFSKVEDKFYTNIIAYQPNPPKKPAKISTSQRLSLASKVITKPFLIRNHLNRALEILVQDSALQLYHISSDFDIIWANRLTESVVGSIVPVDYFRNSKTQYAFCTTSQMHIIDRTGAYVEGFPKAVPSKNPIAHFSVVDYDGSKNYRFMLTDAKGNIYLLDKAGKSLAGWNPKSTGSALLSPPSHIRVAGKDAFIVAKKKGVIDLLSRRGTPYSGFPLDLKSEIVEGYFTEATGSFGTSKMTTLTEDGELVRINFSGNIEHREQLFKPNANTTFRLIPDVLENTFIIVRKSDNLWEVLDGGGAKLFEKTYLKDANRIVQYYRFGGGRALTLVTDPVEGFLTIYEMDGKIMTQEPLQSSNPVSILYSENGNSYTLYMGRDSVIEKVSVK
ncbi:MAG: DUF3352 domain-containing protein [Cytophagales bacterium]|nr:DUF3352 domain-containing protein [Cytophagales bacterium]